LEGPLFRQNSDVLRDDDASLPLQQMSTEERLVADYASTSLLAKGNPALPENPIPDVIDMPYSGNKLHPTQKPVAALKPLIEAFTQKNELILDPFCGSGSIPLAAKILNRRYLGIELDPQYHAAATKRLHPDGIRAHEGFCSPQMGQASRPMPPVGGALQASAAL
jgi:hypothetical protein